MKSQKDPVHLKDELADMSTGRPDLDVRMLSAIAGDRTLNEREKNILNKLNSDRGDSIFSDMLYALTYKSFPSKQAKQLWHDILDHRSTLKQTLGRDLGLPVAAHDYLENVARVLTSVALIEESKMASFATSASKDGLTGLFDNTTFKHRLQEECERQTRYDTALSLVMCDLDHFKKVNDTYGHAEGDIVLQKVADIILRQIRKIDTAARFGGEEFAVILPGVDPAGAFIFAERMRQAIEDTFEDTPMKITISAGIASAAAGAQSDPLAMIRLADKHLYHAKAAGRNRVYQY